MNEEIFYFSSWDEIDAYIGRDAGDAPGSPYGVKAREWKPVAVAACVSFIAASGEDLTAENVDWIVGLVVNGHDDIDYIIREYGPEAGINPDDYL